VTSPGGGARLLRAPALAASVLRCPFCGAEETDRFDLAGERFLVFACAFAPRVDPALSEEELRAELARSYPAEGQSRYFRGMCDRLHLYVLREGRAEGAATR
jgi:hypothetical protein